ncbi:MAG: tetratricopeptide repeat protein [Terracidiphilus sp.]|nr:tetratricopeptide repeat protein [Terracidiphilus sp.]
MRVCLPGAALAAVIVQGCFCINGFAQSAKAASSRAQTVQRSSPAFEALKDRAQAALNADKLDEAVPLLRKALALNPRWTEGWWSLGTTLYDQDRYAEAGLALKKVVALDPKQGTARALLGLCEFELGDDAAALRDIEASKDVGVDVDPQLRDVLLYHEGILLQRMGRFVAAEKPFASMCVGETRNPDVIRGFGMAALRMRNRTFPVPGSEAGRAVELVGRGACLAAHKDIEQARAVFSSAEEAYPHFPYIHYAYARVLNDAQDTAGAVAEFKRELDEGHDRVLSLLQIAAAEYKVDSAAGLPYAEQAVRLAPQMPFAHFLLGLLLQSTGANVRAVTELEIASKGLSQDKRVFWALGVAYNQAGRAEDAARARAEFARLNQKAKQQAESSVEVPD